jgi:hypothetical protein
MQTHQTNSKTRPSHAGSSTSPEKLTDNPSTHHHDHRLDAQKEAGEEGEEGEEVMEEVMEEADCLPQLDQACSHHMDELPTLTNFWVANPRRSQGTEQRSNPSSRNGSYTAESTQTMPQYKTNTKEQCCSSPTSRVTWFALGS